MNLLSFNENKKRAILVSNFYSRYKKTDREAFLCRSISNIKLDEYYAAVKLNKRKLKTIKRSDSFTSQDLKITPGSDIYDFIPLLNFIMNRLQKTQNQEDLKKDYDKYIDSLIHSFAISLKITDKVDSNFFPIGNKPDIETSFVLVEFMLKAFELFKDLRILNQLIQLLNLIDSFSFRYKDSRISYKSFNLKMDFKSKIVSINHSYRFLNLYNKISKKLIDI